jgi:ABC-type transport system involved in cytochrome c biogenesis ATPase subunit
MLIEFRVQNFRSFREEAVLSMVAGNYDRSLPENLAPLNAPGFRDMNAVKAAAVYGANASGKSNLIQALAFLRSYVENSFVRLQPGQPTGCVPFRLDAESAAKPTLFEVAFLQAGVRYLYRFGLSAERVVEEALVAYPKGKPQVWFERKWAASQTEWSAPTDNFRYGRGMKEMTRENALFLSTGAQMNHAQLVPVYEWFQRHLRFLPLEADRPFFPAFTNGLHKARPDLFQRVVGMVRDADFGVGGVELLEKSLSVDELRSQVPPVVFAQLEAGGNIEDAVSTSVRLQHAADGARLVAIDFAEESAGTRRFYALAGPWLDVLDGGYTVCVDELENSLHPALVKVLLGMFFNPETNPKGAQLIFTTHNATLLNSNLLRRDQIWFTEKRRGGDSFLYPLTDYKPRADESLEKGYLAGRYGGVPVFAEAGDRVLAS